MLRRKASWWTSFGPETLPQVCDGERKRVPLHSKSQPKMGVGLRTITIPGTKAESSTPERVEGTLSFCLFFFFFSFFIFVAKMGEEKEKQVVVGCGSIGCTRRWQVPRILLASDDEPSSTSNCSSSAYSSGGEKQLKPPLVFRKHHSKTCL